ncbi:MAG: Fe-S cluster assembly scaffold protein NifU [Candidatus Goldiibacteriota bacterium HGW-Goldbacteria-1]|jgi:nitrogen fixation NifU-like protein|nr:MAG: Fe-S cluster assembly scaffold protein NifU [Candidatus Goldiibacteriota bacterium HGW-Goldbacteria-1]
MKYSEKVMERFKNLKNMGRIDNADGIGKVGNARCGDVMWIYIKVDDGIITDCKFETFGCVAAIATSSMATDLVKGMTVEKALEVTNKSIVELLDGLPPEKLHCSVLAEDGIRRAIEDYNRRKQGLPPLAEKEDDGHDHGHEGEEE